MKKVNLFLMGLCLVLGLTACSHTPQEPSTPENDSNTTEPKKTLVVYYSATGNTKEAANYIAEATGADIFELAVKIPYTEDDLNWRDENSRVVYEYENPDERHVELESTDVINWEKYDTVFIGYPVWWGIAAWPVNGFVEANDFTGKTVIPFCTSSSSGLGESGSLLAELAGSGNWQQGERFSSHVTEEMIKNWLDSLDLQNDAN